MGWYPTVIDDSLKKNLKAPFWRDLQKHLKATHKAYEDKKKELGENKFFKLSHKKRPPDLPDGFGEYCLNSLEDLKYDAFDPDHMEHIAQWLWDKDLWFLFEKHKVSGAYVLHHEDGGGYYSGIVFEDGVPYKAETKITITRGKRLLK